MTLAAAVLAATLALAPPDLRAELESCHVDLRDLERFYDVEPSRSRLERLGDFVAERRARLASLDPAGLDEDSRVDRLLLLGWLEHRAFQLAEERSRLAEDLGLLPFAEPLEDLETARRHTRPLDAPAVAEILAELARATRELRESFGGRSDGTRDAVPEAAAERAEPPDRPDPSRALRLARATDSLLGALRRWWRHYDGYAPEASWWLAEPVRALETELEAYARTLREDCAGVKGADDDPLVGEPIGAAALAAALRREVLPYSAEELLAIGESELAWCDRQMQQEAARLGFPADAAGVAAALERIKADHAPPGGQDELVRAQADEAIAFLDERALVTVPALCRETWRVDMMSAGEQRVLPFAAYGGQKMVVAFPTAAMDDARKRQSLRGNNVHFSRIVTPHELIPGHHLQGFAAARQRPWRRPFGTAFLVEGWCLHWEMRFDDLGWAEQPADRLGLLFWRRHRAARIVVSLSFHLGRMGTAEMVDFLVERVGHERDGATGEVRRSVGGDYDPLYQCAYLIGGLQLRTLHTEAVGRRGLDERAFHDAVLAQNAIPIEWIRARLLELPLPAEPDAAWRFADR